MRAKGGQHYAIPHMKKGTLERIGQLPLRLQVEKEIYEDAVHFLDPVRLSPSFPPPRAAARRCLAPLSLAECRRRLEPRSAAAANAATPRPRPEPRTVRSAASSSDDPSRGPFFFYARHRRPSSSARAEDVRSAATAELLAPTLVPAGPSRGPSLRRAELRSSPAGTEQLLSFLAMFTCKKLYKM